MDSPKEKLQLIEKELALHQEKLRISQSLVKIGFWELNLKNKSIHLSEEAIAILKKKNLSPSLSLKEFAGLSVENDSDFVYQQLLKLTEGTSNLNVEFVLNRKIDNKDIIINAIANCSIESNYIPNTLIGIVQDVTEQKNTEQILKNAKNRAEEADTLKSAFLANMSHEIRTPLNAILGFSHLLTNPELDNTQRKEYSEYITSSANNLLNLIRDIIDVSKIEAGKINVEQSKCEVNKILKELKFTFEREKINQNKTDIDIQLHTAVNDDNFAILTDPYRFHQILVNLIGNALKFIEKGFIEFGYVFSSKSVLQFYIKDTGIGIPNDKIDIIFNRFGQIINNKIKNPAGTGLGLSITKHLVERLGGKIWVASEPEVGTTFYFTLPFEQIENKDSEQITLSNEFEQLEIGDLKILAVEDDPINMILLEDTLKMYIAKLHITKAYNGLEAIKLIREMNFDLVIMDIRMPHLDGYETTKKIRTELPYPKNITPILGLSAHALSSEIEKGKKLGMNDFLSKPIQHEELLMKIKQLSAFAESNVNSEQASDIQMYNYFNSINLSFFYKLFKNDTGKIKNTLKEYVKQVPRQLESLKRNLENEEPEKLKTTSHSLKSTFKYIGRQDLSEISRELEMLAGNKEKKEKIMLNIENLNAAWQEIYAEIRDNILLELK
ncbi:MAG: response regulator [Bacteroidales bacterium]|nr:response regulator [Bacteroidales bacterium]